MLFSLSLIHISIVFLLPTSLVAAELAAMFQDKQGGVFRWVGEAYGKDVYKRQGKNADYIPYLANIDPKLFGISIFLMNGEIIQLGDSQYLSLIHI